MRGDTLPDVLDDIPMTAEGIYPGPEPTQGPSQLPLSARS